MDYDFVKSCIKSGNPHPLRRTLLGWKYETAGDHNHPDFFLLNCSPSVRLMAIMIGFRIVLFQLAKRDNRNTDFVEEFCSKQREMVEKLTQDGHEDLQRLIMSQTLPLNTQLLLQYALSCFRRIIPRGGISDMKHALRSLAKAYLIIRYGNHPRLLSCKKSNLVRGFFMNLYRQTIYRFPIANPQTDEFTRS